MAKSCQTCGKATHRKKFCSIACRKQATPRVTCHCLSCGSEFSRYETVIRNNELRGVRAGVYCSRKCYYDGKKKNG